VEGKINHTHLTTLNTRKLILVISILLVACGGVSTQTPEEPTQEVVKTPATTLLPKPTATILPELISTPELVSPTDTTEAITSCPDGPITVSVHDWSSPDRQEYWDQVINAFNIAHDCIKAEPIKLPNDRQARLQEISAGNAPCLVGIDSSDLPRMYWMGALLDLTPLMSADNFDPKAEFFESVINTGVVDGKLVAIAKDYSISAFYVNTDLIKKAGLEIPEEGWTYEEYLQYALLLTIDENGNNATSPNFNPSKIVQWGGSFPYWGGANGWWRGFQSALYSFGAHTISDDGKTTNGFINSNKAIQTWEWFRNFIHMNHVAPSATVMTTMEQGFSDLFEEQKLAIAGSYWGPWFQDIFNDVGNLNWTVVPLPVGPGGHKAAMMWMGWGVNSNCKTPNQAWQLLKWLATDPGQQVFALKGLTADISTAAELQQDKDPFWSIFLAEIPFQDRLDDLTTPYYTSCVDIPASELLGKIFQDEGATLEIKTELDKLADSADRCLAGSTIE